MSKKYCKHFKEETTYLIVIEDNRTGKGYLECDKCKNKFK